MGGLLINPYVFGPIIGAVLFDGTNDYLTRGGDWTGSSDTKTFIVSFWLKIEGGGGTTRRILDDTTSFNLVEIDSSDKIRIKLQNVITGTILDIKSTTSFTADGLWHHFMSSGDMAAGTAYLYRDGVEDKTTTTAPVNFSADWTRTEHSVGATTVGGSLLNVDMAEFYFNIATSLDLSVSTNRDKFYNAGRPVSLGADGSTPTGSQPLVYLKHVPGAAATDFGTNLGSGGGMTITGTLTEVTDAP